MWAHIQVKVNVYAVVSHMHADLGWHGADNFPWNVILICVISPVYCHSTMMLWQLSNSLTPFAVVVGSIFSELQALLLLLYSMSTHLLCLPLSLLFCWEECHCLAHPRPWLLYVLVCWQWAVFHILWPEQSIWHCPPPTSPSKNFLPYTSKVGDPRRDTQPSLQLGVSSRGEQHVATLKVAQGWEVVCDPFTKGEYVILQEQEHVVSGVLDKLVRYNVLWGSCCGGPWTNYRSLHFFSIKVCT